MASKQRKTTCTLCRQRRRRYSHYKLGVRIAGYPACDRCVRARAADAMALVFSAKEEA